MGGFGISRHFLDNELKNIAQENGVIVYEQTKVAEVTFEQNLFTVKFNNGQITSSIVAAGFGKRSNLDIKWKRDFIKQKPGKLNNYIGVKYHVKSGLPGDTIALHNFKDGYCGISKVEDEKYCLCYLTTAKNLKDNHNSIKELEKNILYKNPFLKEIFTTSEFIFPEPVTISQISFDKKEQVLNHMLMLGDAAGLITPLCGNGMSMAFHSSKIAFENIVSFFNKSLSRKEMENQYSLEWQNQFGKRLRNGRFIQFFFGKNYLTNIFVKLIKLFPFLTRQLIKSTHGKEF
jgi:flavin-dependent dehydrogenase